MTSLLLLTLGCESGLDALSLFQRAAVDQRFDGGLRSQFKDAVDDDLDRSEPVRFFVRGDLDPAWRDREGLGIGLDLGDLRTAEGSLEDVAALVETDVARVEMSHTMEPQSGPSVTETQAYELWGFGSLPASGSAPAYPADGLTGKGVVIGVIDTGLDVDHDDFRASGTCGLTDCTRVLKAWNQSQAIGTHPDGFTYGAEYTQAQIDAGSAVLPDADGHGTHVMGIAAGNGRATGNGQPAYAVLGMAPDADLLMAVAAPYDEARVVDAVSWIFDQADALGQPAVANISLGSESGPHDGSLIFDEMLGSLAGPGHLVSVAAGNYGAVDRHARVPSVSGVVEVPVNVPTYTYGFGARFFGVEAWHDVEGSLDMKVTSPSGWSSGWLSPGASLDVVTSDGWVMIGNQWDTTETATLLRLYVRTDSGHDPAAGTWKIAFQQHGGGADVPVDLWIPYINLGSVPKFTAYVDKEHTLASIATVDDMIVTGATTLERSWTVASTGANAVLLNTCTTATGCTNPVGGIADFSSRGPRRDGTEGLDVVAPGNAVVSALSSLNATYGSNPYYTVPDGVHRIRYGTSMAAAHTTGMLALLLEADPTLDPDAARDLLRDAAAADSFTGAVPNTVAGYGKLRAPDIFGGPDADASDFEPALVGTTSGLGIAAATLTAPFNASGTQVVVRDADGVPIPGSTVVLDFSGSVMKIANTQPAGITVDCTARTLTATTDSSGVATFKAKVGGAEATANVEVWADDVFLGTMKARSVEWSGNGIVDLADLSAFSGAYLGAPWDVTFDYDQTGSVGLGDYAAFGAEMVAGWRYTACL